MDVAVSISLALAPARRPGSRAAVTFLVLSVLTLGCARPEPEPSHQARAPLSYVRPGAACGGEVLCASGECTDGKCPCVKPQDKCQRSAECCGGWCVQERCVSCIPNWDDRQVAMRDSTDSSSSCPGPNCNDPRFTPVGAPKCSRDDDCCSHYCDPGTSTCRAAPVGTRCPPLNPKQGPYPYGPACQLGICTLGVCACAGTHAKSANGVECCSGIAAHGECAGRTAKAACTRAVECSSGQCTDGRCQCRQGGAQCRGDAECCSGRCNPDDPSTFRAAELGRPGRCCVPRCGERICGDDGCGGSCGECPAGMNCASNGLSCVNPPPPPPGCGTHTGDTCSEHGQCCSNFCYRGTCHTFCAVEGHNCYRDGDCCTGKCYLPSNKCVCVPDCTNRECGSNGCGGTCGGACPAGMSCTPWGKCLRPSGGCTPSCAGKQCGDDGCGGSCGGCPANYACNAGTCARLGVPPGGGGTSSCTELTACVKHEFYRLKGLGHCDGKAVGYFTNNCGVPVICSYQPEEPSGQHHECGGIDVRVGERRGGELAGFWFCGLSAQAKIRWTCVPATQDACLNRFCK